MTRSIPLIGIVLVCVLSFSMFGCEERDDSVEDSLIPDDELRSEIRASLSMDFDTTITAEDMLKLTELDADAEGGFQALVDSAKISDLTGLEYAENLVVLSLWANHIKDASPLKGLKNLTELNLESNYLLADVSPLQGLKNLEELNLGGNDIVDINPLAGLKNLQRLWLQENELVDVSPLEGLENLQRLDLSNNEIVDVSPLEGLKKLQTLWLEKNEIVGISPLKGLRILNQLHLDNNKLVDISPLKGLKNLRWLYLNDNYIVDVSPLEELKNLRKLDLTNNPLSYKSKNLIIPIIEAYGTEVLY